MNKDNQKYAIINTPINSCLYSVKRYDNQWGVIDKWDNVVVPFGKYRWIDGFHNGFAKVISHEDTSSRNVVRVLSLSEMSVVQQARQGIINEQGNEVIPTEFNVWKFYGKNFPSIIIETNSGDKHKIPYNNLRNNPMSIIASLRSRHNIEKANDDNDSYGQGYDEFSGSYAQDVMGYSDDVINDAFEGDPDMYWNID